MASVLYHAISHLHLFLIVNNISFHIVIVQSIGKENFYDHEK